MCLTEIIIQFQPGKNKHTDVARLREQEEEEDEEEEDRREKEEE